MLSRSLNAAVFGPTGAVGAEVIRQCLHDPRIAQVTAITRRPLPIRHEKLREVIAPDFLNLEPVADSLTGQDVCFYCLGVSQTQEKDPSRYREITYGYAMEAARMLLDRSPDHVFHFLSGRGADQSGRARLLFARVKGKTERDLTRLPMPKLVIWRPGYISPVQPREKSSPFYIYDRIFRPFYLLLRRLFPGLGTDTLQLARAMIQATFEGRTKGIIDNREIGEIYSRTMRT